MKLKTFFLIIFECLTLSVTPKVFINEYMQSNANTLFDEEYNLPESWVELYNDSNNMVSLKGWKIGKKKLADAYSLPDSLQIPPKGFLILFCDESNLGGRHTDFELPVNNENGKITLFNNSGEIEDEVVINTSSSYDYSVGRYPDGASTLHYFTKATPNAPNKNIAKSIETTPIVIFSKEGGVFENTNEIKITLSTNQQTINGKEVKIKYTTDGSEPTEKSSTYTAPLHLTNYSDSLKCYVIKAKTFADSTISSKSVTNSYIFAGRYVDLPIMSISTNPDYLWDNDYGIYVKGNGRGTSIFKDSYPYTDDYNFWSNNVRFCNIEYFSKKESSADINMPAEIRIGGNSTRWNIQKPLMVTWKKRFSNKKSFDFPFFKSKSDILNFKSFMLRNAGNDSGYETDDGEAFLRDPYCQVISSQFENIDYQAYQPTILFLDGVYYGIFNIRERSNEKYIESNYNIENVDVIENYTDVKAGDTEHLDYSLKILEEHSSYEEVKSLFDVEEFTNYLSLNLFMANKDFISNNVVMWRKKQNGKWRFICKDMDITAGTKKWGSKKFDVDLVSHFFTESCITKDFIDYPEYEKTFVSNHIVNIGTYFCKNKTLHILDSLAYNIEYEIAFHNDKYQLIEDWYSEIEYMREWLKNRPYYESVNLAKFFGLGQPVPTVIAGTEHDTLLMDSIKILNNRFEGYLFDNKEMTLSSSNPDVFWKLIKFHNGMDTIEVVKSQHISIKPEKIDSIIILADIEKLPDSAVNKYNNPNQYTPISLSDGVFFENISDIQTISVYNSTGLLVQKLDKLKTNKINIKLPEKNCVYMILLTDKHGKIHIYKFVFS